MSVLQALRPPNLRPVGRIVGDDPRIGGRDDLLAAGMAITIGVDQELGTGRATCQTIRPVAESKASSFDFGARDEP